MKGRFSTGINLIMILVFVIITFFSVSSLDVFRTERSASRPEEIRKAILDACVECYALEGSYPPSLEYLAEHYGVIMDEDEYYYYYQIFASNVLPDVEVYEK